MSDTDSAIPERESQRVEFKAREALDDLPSIGREVVAFLNAEGGCVWIGVGEENGVAGSLESIPSARSTAEGLRDYLLDAIDPSPSHHEVTVRVHEIADRALIRIDVAPGSHKRRPVCLVRRGWRLFVTRVGARIRLLSREEILGSDAGQRTDETGRQEARARLGSLRAQVATLNEGTLWIGVRPASALQLSLDALDALLVDPALSDNRPHGAVFPGGPGVPKVKSGYRETNWVRLHDDGSLECRAPLDALFWHGEGTALFHPLVLIELSVSALRLARAIYLQARTLGATLRDDSPILADAAFIGLRGAGLGRGSPAAIRHVFGALRYEDGDDLMWARPVEFRWRDLRDTPDRCAYRLVIRRTYEAFGFRENEIPEEFDRERGEFTLAPRLSASEIG